MQIFPDKSRLKFDEQVRFYKRYFRLEIAALFLLNYGFFSIVMLPITLILFPLSDNRDIMTLFAKGFLFAGFALPALAFLAILIQNTYYRMPPRLVIELSISLIVKARLNASGSLINHSDEKLLGPFFRNLGSGIIRFKNSRKFDNDQREVLMKFRSDLPAIRKLVFSTDKGVFEFIRPNLEEVALAFHEDSMAVLVNEYPKLERKLGQVPDFGLIKEKYLKSKRMDKIKAFADKHNQKIELVLAIFKTVLNHLPK